MEPQRIITAGASGEDEALEASIRPKRLDEYLGQQPVREQLGIYIEAARGRGMRCQGVARHLRSTRRCRFSAIIRA